MIRRETTLKEKLITLLIFSKCISNHGQSITIPKKPYLGFAKLLNPIVVPIVEVSKRDELKCLWSRVKMIKIPK